MNQQYQVHVGAPTGYPGRYSSHQHKQVITSLADFMFLPSLFSRFSMPRCLALLACVLAASSAAYDPTWESLDQRTAPDWFLQEKFYIFVQYVQFTVRLPAPLFTPSNTFLFFFFVHEQLGAFLRSALCPTG